MRSRWVVPVVLLCALAGGALQPLSAADKARVEMKPLSAEDKARVETLLKNFDPNSYSLKVEYLDASGKVAVARLGKAVGLANVKQTKVERDLTAAAAASTNTNNNIFRLGKAASTNTNNNIFRAASTNTNNNIFKLGRTASTNTNNNIFKLGKAASTNTNNNIFALDKQAAAAQELNTILQKYSN